MKYIKYFLIVLVLVILSCESSVEGKKTISGRVYYAESNEPAGSAKVFHGSGLSYLCMNYCLSEFTFTNSNGTYMFVNDADAGTHYIYATKIERNSFVSPVISFYDGNENTLEAQDILLYEVQTGSSVIGITTNAETDEIIPHNKIKLFRLEEMQFVQVDSTYSDEEGRYSFTNMQTGNHLLKSEFEVEELYTIWIEKDFFINGIESQELLLPLNADQADKPAIYIYPEEEGQYQVNLTFNNKTKLTKSIPDYNNGWNVFVEKSGKIDGEYSYLFYENSMEDLPYKLPGWSIKQDNIQKELPTILHKLGLNTQEIFDFMEYWLPRLDEHEFYNFKLLINEQLDNYVELDISTKPDSVLRLLFFFEGCKEYEKLPTPSFSEFKRSGTTVVEWGGVLLN
jgi:hypothetical protein